MTIKALKFKDHNFGRQWFEEVEDHWEYKDILRNEAWRKKWISFDCCLYIPETDKVYCGITSFDADIFWAYDRKSNEFVDCEFGRVRDSYDAKFHRSIVKWNNDGCIYTAIALLHDVDNYWDAPGGAVVKYDFVNNRIEKIGIPLPHVYIQSICIDQKHGVLYGQTFTPERMIRFDITTGKSDDLGPISSAMSMAQGENIEIDDDGCAWCGWSVTRAWQSSPGVDSNRLCKFDPKERKIQYFNAGLPNPDGSYGYVKVDGIFNLGNGCLYASGGNGSIYRVDTKTGKGTYLGTPADNRPSRLSSLRMAVDGLAYGVVGKEGNCELISFDPKKEKFKILAPIIDGDAKCWQIHDVTITPDGTIYAGENDNPYRSSYLWEIKL